MATTAKKSGKATIKVGKLTYRRESCHSSPAAAKKKAEALRKQGYTATTRGNCAFKGRKRKKTGGKKRK